MQSKMVFKIFEGILHSSFNVKEFDVIVHKKYFSCITLWTFWPFCITSLANLVAEEGTRHGHQILFLLLTDWWVQLISQSDVKICTQHCDLDRLSSRQHIVHLLSLWRSAYDIESPYLTDWMILLESFSWARLGRWHPKLPRLVSRVSTFISK